MSNLPAVNYIVHECVIHAQGNSFEHDDRPDETRVAAVCATLHLARQVVLRLLQLGAEDKPNHVQSGTLEESRTQQFGCFRKHWWTYYRITENPVAETLDGALLRHSREIDKTQPLAEQKGNDNE